MTLLAGLIIGALCGWWANYAIRKLDEVLVAVRRPKPEVGPTRSEVINPYPYAANDPQSHIVEPKSPQLLRFEEEQELRAMQLRGK